MRISPYHPERFLIDDASAPQTHIQPAPSARGFHLVAGCVAWIEPVTRGFIAADARPRIPVSLIMSDYFVERYLGVGVVGDHLLNLTSPAISVKPSARATRIAARCGRQLT